MASLESVVGQIRSGKQALEKMNQDTDALREELYRAMLNHKVEGGHGETLYDLAKEQGKEHDFAQYAWKVADRNVRALGLDNMLNYVEEILLGQNKVEGSGLQTIPMKFAGRTVLLPAYVTVYTAQRILRSVFGGLPDTGYYNVDATGGIDHVIDSQVQDARQILKMAGLDFILNTVNLPDLEDRVRDASVKRAEYWVTHGGKPLNRGLDYKLFEKVKGLFEGWKEGKLKGYEASRHYDGGSGVYAPVG